MKKKILSAAFAVAIMAIAGYNVYMNQTKSDLSKMALANVEALAEGDYATGTLNDCEIFCMSAYNYNCHITYTGDVEGITCPKMRIKKK